MAKKVEVDAKLLIVAVALLIIATVGSAFATYLIFGRGNTEVVQGRESSEKKRAMGPTYDMGEFILNLTSTTNQMRFIRTKVTLEASDTKVITELEARGPQLRDRLITLIRSRTAEELSSEAGMEALRLAIITSINGLINNGEITDVFFLDLIVQ